MIMDNMHSSTINMYELVGVPVMRPNSSIETWWLGDPPWLNETSAFELPAAWYWNAPKGLCDSSWISWTALPMTAAPTPMKGNLGGKQSVKARVWHPCCCCCCWCCCCCCCSLSLSSFMICFTGYTFCCPASWHTSPVRPTNLSLWTFIRCSEPQVSETHSSSDHLSLEQHVKCIIFTCSINNLVCLFFLYKYIESSNSVNECCLRSQLCSLKGAFHPHCSSFPFNPLNPLN